MDSIEPMEHASSGGPVTSGSLPDNSHVHAVVAGQAPPPPKFEAPSDELAILIPPDASEVATAYDELAEGYDDFHVDTKSLAENGFVARHLASRISARTRVLDLGCGTGLLLDLLPIAPDCYVGIDVSRRMLDTARGKHPNHRFVLADAQQLDPAFGQFDMVVSLFGSASYCELDPLAASVAQMQAEEGGHFLMFCGPRYVQRSTYINKSSSLLNSFNTASLQSAYPASRVWGMSWSVDVAPNGTPVSIMQRLLSFDVKTVGRMAPDRCFFLVVEA